jgi:hypothetical protein
MNAPINKSNSSNTNSSNQLQNLSLVPNRSTDREPTRLNYGLPFPNSNVANLAFAVYGIYNTLNQQNNTSPAAVKFRELQTQAQAVQAKIAINATLYKEVRGIFDSMKNLAKQLLGMGQKSKDENPTR